MLRNYYQGTMITVELPKNQYKGYVVDCIYRYVKDIDITYQMDTLLPFLSWRKTCFTK